VARERGPLARSGLSLLQICERVSAALDALQHGRQPLAHVSRGLVLAVGIAAMGIAVMLSGCAGPRVDAAAEVEGAEGGHGTRYGARSEGFSSFSPAL